MRLILPIILCIAAIGLFVVYTNPTYQNIKNLQIQDSQYDYALTQSSELRRLRDTLTTRRNSFSTDDVRKIERLLPDSVDNIRLIIDINDIAARYHLQVSNVSLGQNATQADLGGSPVGSVTLGFSVTATFPQFLAFLGDLERSLRLIDIESIHFSISGSQPQSQLPQYNLQIRTYWLH